MAIAAVAAIGSTGCKKAKVNAFPDSGAVAGWQKTGEARVFEAKNLYEYIDGVVTTSTADYKYQSGLEATVDVHTMGNAAGAQKIMDHGQTKDAKSVQLGDAGITYAQSVIFRKGPYLVRIVAYESTPDAPQALLALAHGIESKL